MAFEFRETFLVPLPDVETRLSDFRESAFKDSHGLIVEIAAVHEGITQNYNQYTAAELANAIHTWYTPYPKPIIMNHDKLSEPVGRAIGAKMAQEQDGTPYVRLQAAIMDPVAIQKVLDKRYITGSIGGKTDEAICSVCSTDWAAPRENMRGLPCPHQRGKVYKGKVATLEMRGLTFMEYSFVNMPADSLSGVRDISVKESDEWDPHPAKFFVLDLGNESVVEYKEGAEVDILGEMKKKDASPLYHNMKGAFIEAQIICNNESQESAITYTGDTMNIDDGVTSDSEENSMANEDKVDTEEDILAVTEELSEDLDSASTEEAVEDSEEDSEVVEQTETEEASDTTDSGDESEVEEAEQAHGDETDAEATTSSDAPEAREGEEEEAEEVTESDTEAEAEGEEVSEQAENTELTATEKDSEPDVDQLKSEIDTLKEENAKLKKALHRTLAERVVDAKISAGLINSEDRKESVVEHSTRTAASLADSLRDLASMPAAKPTAPVESIEDRSTAVDEGIDNSTIVEGDKVEEDTKTPEQILEDRIFDTLMGRKPL